jgi:CheY-like chemotaxis protein
MQDKKILVVDDEADMRIFVATVVETSGFEAVVAVDGEDAFQKASEVLPCLMILDLMMPHIDDGLKAYKRFKSDPSLAEIPIIMLSAIARRTFFNSLKTLPGAEGQALPEPAAYMEKPPDAGELVDLINDILKAD